MASTEPRPPARWRVVDDIALIFVEPDVSLSEELWQRATACFDRELAGCLFIVGRDGFAKLSKHQWRRAAVRLGELDYPIAVFSSHRMTQAMVRAAMWHGATIRAFRWREIDAALDFLGVARERHERLRTAAELLLRKSV